MRIETKSTTASDPGKDSQIAGLQKQLLAVQKQLSALTKQLASTVDRDARRMLQAQIEALQRQLEMIQEQMTRLAIPVGKRGLIQGVVTPGNKPASGSLRVGGQLDTLA